MVNPVLTCILVCLLLCVLHQLLSSYQVFYHLCLLHDSIVITSLAMIRSTQCLYSIMIL